jgi:hypothetical protein
MGGVTDFLFGGDQQQTQVGPTLEETMAMAAPWGVSAPGIGSTTVDMDARQISTTVDPKMQALANMFLERMGKQTAAISGYDPAQAAQDYYQQYVAPDLMRQQEQERLALENRLLGQGMLGATGGALRMGELARAQSAEQRAGRAGAFTQAQDLLNQMRQREAADLAAMAGIYEGPVSLMKTGAGIGGTMGQIAAGYTPTYQTSGGGSGLLGSLMPAIGSYAGSASGSAAITSGLGKIGSMFASMSDERLKKNVVKIGRTAKGINWYKWDWNDKANELGIGHHRTTGVMAQEVKNIIPEAVIMGDDGYYRVDYSKVV